MPQNSELDCQVLRRNYTPDATRLAASIPGVFEQGILAVGRLAVVLQRKAPARARDSLNLVDP